MKLYRYQYVTPQSLGELNRILRRGWKPVREIPEQESSSKGSAMLVLLEKEAEFASFAGDEIIADVPVDFLQGVMLFDDLSDEELRLVINQCEVRSLQPDATLFQQGDASDAIFVVLKGEIDVRLPELPVQGQSVVRLEPGGVFGESTFFSESAHTMSATTTKDGATVLALERSAYDEMYQAELPVVLKLANNAARILAARLQETDDWVWQLLAQSQQAQISASWRRYRHRVTGSESTAGFFGV